MIRETATFGAGCFWGVEARFAALPGVLDTAAGYAGGSLPHPTYEQVCTGGTGHAEVVEVVFNPERLPYAALLDAFFAMHNPAQPYLDADASPRSQYRSLILTHTAAQAAEAQARLDELNTQRPPGQPLRTAIQPAGAFWRAEDRHQRYLERRNLLPSA